MVWEFPAVSQSRIEFWKKPQFTQSGMWWFTLIFGFLGLHHFYLRSPQTGLIFLIANFISLGYLWGYDLVQLSSSGGYTTETLNKHGLAHPWGAMGLAQGMWKEPDPSFFPKMGYTIPGKILSPPPAPAPAPASATIPTAPPASAATTPTAPPAAATTPTAPPAKQGLGVNFKEYNASGNPRGTMVGGAFARSQVGGAREDEPPNPLWFLLYAITIPCAPLAQLIAGDTNNAVSRFADLTVVPLGFIFYLCAMLYDYWVLFSNPADLLVAGSKRFFPFTYLGMDADGHSEMLTGVSEIKACPPDNFIMTMLRIGKPAISILAPGVGKTIDSALDTKQEVEKTVETTKKLVVDGALAKAQKATQLATQIGSLSTMAPPPGMIRSTDGIAQFRNPVTGQGLGTMVGGRRLEAKETFSTLDYAALGSIGAVIGGGLLLSANRFRNVFTKNNDSPPDPRAVRENVY